MLFCEFFDKSKYIIHIRSTQKYHGKYKIECRTLFLYLIVETTNERVKVEKAKHDWCYVGGKFCKYYHQHSKIENIWRKKERKKKR